LPVLAGSIVSVSQQVLALDPANYQAGPLLFTPTLDTRIGFTDNLFREDDDEKDTGFTVARPRLQTWVEQGLNTYSFTYELADFRYFDSSDDDFTDHTFNLDLHHEFNARNMVNVIGEYYAGHEERGTGLSEGLAELIDEPVEIDRAIFGGDYTYGSKASRGRVRLGAKATDHEYQNFDSTTRFRDRERYDYSGAFFWKVAPRTDATVELRYIDTEYDRTNPADPAGTLDSEEINYLVGVLWEATAQTSGSVKVGYYDREYDSGERSDDDGFSWEVDVTYKPRTYSRLNLESKRYFEETNGLGDAVDTNQTSLSWDHDWNTRSSTGMRFMVGTEDYTGSAREDDLYGIEASYIYALRRWVDLGVGYRYEDRDSDLSLFDYTRNEVFLEARVSL
jgi:hypothetical protein